MSQHKLQISFILNLNKILDTIRNSYASAAAIALQEKVRRFLNPETEN
ncbi:hypothetical protein [Moorena producens]|nr:hypothetical protein [Moorena producens]